jgi:hypothetical protein
MTGNFGSKTPLRILNQRTFDQLFMLAGFIIVGGPLRRIPRRACGITLRLLRLETGHSRRERFEAQVHGVGPVAAVSSRDENLRIADIDLAGTQCERDLPTHGDSLCKL